MMILEGNGSIITKKIKKINKVKDSAARKRFVIIKKIKKEMTELQEKTCYRKENKKK